MKIICFPHYTCGGLLCDIMNHTFSDIGLMGGINSIHHTIGKIGDSDTVFRDFDVDKLNKALEKCSDNSWIATHCWLGQTDLDRFDQVINITTMTYRSKLYRWVRAYHHYYLNSKPWQDLVGLDRIDKQRETAKNYLIPFERIDHGRVINLEFADVVETQQALFDLVGTEIEHHVFRWQKINYFLYSGDLWTSEAVKRFHEAEHEIVLQQRYIYE